MRIIPQPTVNQTAPNYRTNKFGDIQHFSPPFKGDPGPTEFGYWFNYFWAEAVEKPGLTEVEKGKICDVFFAVFEGPTGNYTVKRDFAAKEDSFKENLLRQLLLIGFRRVALEPPPMVNRKGAGGKRIATAPLMAVDAARLNFEAVVLDTKEELPIGFRSDNRSYDDLVKCQGFNARARQGGWVYAAYAMNQRWHPFHNPVYSKSLFLRLGAKNKDNCLHTVVSTGTCFWEITHFPILNDALNFDAKSASGPFLAGKPSELWTDDDIQRAENHRQKLRAVKGTDPGIDHLEKDNHVHVFHTKGLRGFNTQAFFGSSGTFPERAMEQVPVENLLADVHFIQKWWYNPDETKIMLYELEFSPIRWVPSEQAVEKLLGPLGKQKLKALIEEQIQKSLSRFEITSEGAKYKKYQTEKAFRLNATERNQVIAKFKEYIRANLNPKTQRYSPKSSAEKAYLKAQLPLLSAKIDNVDLSRWADLRNAAQL